MSNPRASCEEWLLRNGLPQFLHQSVRWRSVEQAAPALIIILSFALVSEPWIGEFTEWNIYVVGLLAMLGIWLIFPIRWVLNYPLVHEPAARRQRSGLRNSFTPRRRYWLVAIRVVVLLLLSVGLYLTDLPVLYMDVWIDLAVMIVLLVVAARLRRIPSLTRLEAGYRPIALRSLAWLTVASAVLFVPVVATFRRIGWPPYVYPSTLALPVASAILVLALVSTSRSAPKGRPADRRVMQAVSWVVVLLATEVTVVPYLSPNSILAGTVSAILLIAALSNLLAASRRPAAGREHRMSRGVILKAVGVIVLTVTLHLLISLPESSNPGRRLIVELALAVTGSLMITIGIDRTVPWAFREWVRRLADVLEGVVRGLPVLLVLLLFLGINEELWGIADEKQPATFLGIGAVLFLLTIAYLVVDSWREIDSRWASFTTWMEVASHLPERVRSTFDPPHAYLVCPRSRITMGRRANLIVVALIYRTFVLLPAGGVIFFLFLALGRSVVAPRLFTEDEARAEQSLKRWHEATFLDEPWTEVAFLLAVFSILHFAVHLTAEEQRKNFSAQFGGHLAESLAVALVYDFVDGEERAVSGRPSYTGSRVGSIERRLTPFRRFLRPVPRRRP